MPCARAPITGLLMTTPHTSLAPQQMASFIRSISSAPVIPLPPALLGSYPSALPSSPWVLDPTPTPVPPLLSIPPPPTPDSSCSSASGVLNGLESL